MRVALSSADKFKPNDKGQVPFLAVNQLVDIDIDNANVQVREMAVTAFFGL